MAAKFLIVLCAQAVLIQTIYAHRSNVYMSGASSGSSAFGLGKTSSGLSLGKASSGLSLGKASSGLSLGKASSGLSLGKASSGLGLSRSLSNIDAVAGGLSNFNIIYSGPLLVTSISPIGPSSLAVASDNTIKGTLAVTGQLPYLSAVAFDGALPTAGSGVATCGCGNGRVGITTEGLGRPPIYY